MNNALVIIPTYNESENIIQIIDAVLTLPKPFDLLIVDDQSPDGTAVIVKEQFTRYNYNGEEKLHLMERKGKLGLGTAYIDGFKWALSRGYEYILQMDADFSHNPKDLLHLYQTCKDDADLTVGSRYTTGVNVVNWPIGRVLLSYFASAYVRLISGLPVMDATAGFVCYRRKVLETIPLDRSGSSAMRFRLK